MSTDGRREAPDGAGSLERFPAEHPDEAEAIVEKEHQRRERARKKRDASDGG